MAISDYLEPNLVSFLEVKAQDEAIENLVDLLDKEEKLRDKKSFHEAIKNREKLVSTGIGIGVAIPHAKQPGYEDFFIAIGIIRGEGVDWKSLDGLPVHLIFMIGGPEDEQTEYLKILSMITTAIKDEKRRKKLLQAKSAEEVVAIFEDV